MAVDEETGMYAMGQGCPHHGDEHRRECSMCGTEFCRKCHPRTTVCPDCAESGDEDEDEDLDEGEETFDEEEEEDEEDAEDVPRNGDLDEGSDRRY